MKQSAALFLRIYDALKVGEYRIPLGEDGIFHVYFSKKDPANYIPAWTVMDKSVDPARIKGKIVLIGTSAEGLKDIRSTPPGLYIPGVDVHLNHRTGQTEVYLFRPKLMQGAEIIFTAVVGLLVILLAQPERHSSGGRLALYDRGPSVCVVPCF